LNINYTKGRFCCISISIFVVPPLFGTFEEKIVYKKVVMHSEREGRRKMKREKEEER